MPMYYGLHLGGGAALREVDGASKIGEAAEELTYDSIVTGDHITIPKQIDSTYPYVDAATARGQDPYAVEDAARLLVVAPDADAAAIRAAWRREVSAARPDQTNDAASLAALTEARDLLLSHATGRPRR